MIATLKWWNHEEGRPKCDGFNGLPVPKYEVVSSFLGGSVNVRVPGEHEVRPGVKIELELWHPKSQVGRSVDLSLSVEEATHLLTALRSALRDLRN